MKFRYLLIGVLFLSVTACSNLKPVTVSDDDKLARTQTAYIVDTADCSPEMEAALQRSMLDLGIATSSGGLTAKPQDVDVFVKCVDTWTWDIAMYLSALNVSVYDNTTERLLASGGFHNRAFFHTYPNADEVAEDVVKSIFEK